MGRGRLVTVRGSVISDSMVKTIVVRAERKVKHPLYGKYLRHFTKYYAHDEKGESHVGDFVELAATRPISKLKRWRLLRIIRRGAPVAEPIAAAETSGREVEA